MPIRLKRLDLSAATVGAVGSIDFRNQTTGVYLAPTPLQRVNKQFASLRFFNDSGCGLDIQLPDRPWSGHIPAGGWGRLVLPDDVQQIQYTVDTIIPGAQVSVFKSVYYLPGEPMDDIFVLGNSPVGVGGAVSTSGSGGTTFIKNDGNVPATSIIEANVSDQATSSWAFNNDGSGFLQVLSANVLRKVLNLVRGNATSTKAVVTVGDSGDTSILTLYGTLGAGSVVPAATVQPGTFAGGGAFTFPVGDTVGFAAGASFMDANTGAYNTPKGGAINGLTFITGAGSGTFNHNLRTTPVGIIVCPNTGVDSSYTIGVDHITSTTFHVNIGGDAAVAWAAIAFA